jgi:hypothetical protein
MLNREYLHSVFEDYDDAAGASRSRKAITKQTWTVELPRGIRQCKIVKPLFQPPFAVYASAPSIPCPEWQFSYDLVDQCNEWEAF